MRKYFSRLVSAFSLQLSAFSDNHQPSELSTCCGLNVKAHGRVCCTISCEPRSFVMSRRLPVGAPGLLFLTLVLLIVSWGCARKDSKAAPAPQAMPVKVQTARPQKVNETTEYVATLKSRDSAV